MISDKHLKCVFLNFLLLKKTRNNQNYYNSNMKNLCLPKFDINNNPMYL